jgi:hypothetical protein
MTYKEKPIKITADFLTKTLKARRACMEWGILGTEWKFLQPYDTPLSKTIIQYR